MMFEVELIFFSCVVAQVASHAIKVECEEDTGFPPTSNESPSFLAALKVEQVSLERDEFLNISWAIKVDVSNPSLKGTRIRTGEGVYSCEYNPPFANQTDAAQTNTTQVWFYYLVSVGCGSYHIQAANIPLPPLGSGLAHKRTSITIPCQKTPSKPSVIPTTSQVPPAATFTAAPSQGGASGIENSSIVAAIFGGLAILMILTSCYIIYKRVGAKFATSLGFKRLPMSTVVPIPVLLVYPAENSSFQRAVVALAEFLQWHGGCSVAVDVWQQGKIAELGPMRWLAEQAKAAHRVLVVCPQPSSKPSHSPSHHSFPEPSIPAAAHDLYPLILNMVASKAKNASDLAKFWVVQLGEQRDTTRPCNRAPELRACRTFSLMKDLNKLCRSLHTQRQGNKKMSDMIFRPALSVSKMSTVKLREAVEKLGGHHSSISKEVEPLKSVVTSI